MIDQLKLLASLFMGIALLGCQTKPSTLTTSMVQCEMDTEFLTTMNYRLDSTANAVASTVATDNTGNLFVSGYGPTSEGGRWMTRKSSDRGVEWETIDSAFYFPDATMGSISPSNGALLVMGDSNESTTKLIVRRSTDSGSTWSSVLDLAQASAGSAIAKSPSGSLFLATNDESNFEIEVRKSTDQGANFTLVDESKIDSATASAARGIYAVDDNTIYVVGGQTNSAGSHWIVRKSTNAGSSFSGIDDFQKTNNYDSQANFVWANSDGIVVVGGYTTIDTSTSIKRWTIRRSTDSGAAFETVDEFEFVADKASEANSIVYAPDGALYVSGAGVNESNVYVWIVRRSFDFGQTWETVDDYQYYPWSDSKAQASVVDEFGNLFVVGYGNDSSSIARWIVRKLPCH